MVQTKSTPKLHLPNFSRLRWRLTLNFTLVTLAAILMAAWWSFLAINLYLASTLPEPTLAEVRAQLLPTLVPLIVPALLVLILPAVLVGTAFGFLTARWLENRLERLREATDAWSAGDFFPRIFDPARDEIGRFGRQLNQMAAELETLMRTRQELAGMEERNQLARDLHDSVKQHLAAAVLQLGAAQALLESSPAAASQALAQAEDLAVQAQQELTNVILELRPAALHEKNLTGALQSYLDQWSLQNKIEVTFEAGSSAQLSFNQELALFRFAQEALANIARHSQASQAKVSLKQQGNTLQLAVADNGRGFSPSADWNPGFGLTSMQDRLAALGGSVDVQSSPGAGTRVLASLPLHRQAAQREGYQNES